MTAKSYTSIFLLQNGMHSLHTLWSTRRDDHQMSLPTPVPGFADNNLDPANEKEESVDQGDSRVI